MSIVLRDGLPLTGGSYEIGRGFAAVKTIPLVAYPPEAMTRGVSGEDVGLSAALHSDMRAPGPYNRLLWSTLVWVHAHVRDALQKGGKAIDKERYGEYYSPSSVGIGLMANFACNLALTYASQRGALAAPPSTEETRLAELTQFAHRQRDFLGLIADEIVHVSLAVETTLAMHPNPHSPGLHRRLRDANNALRLTATEEGLEIVPRNFDLDEVIAEGRAKNPRRRKFGCVALHTPIQTAEGVDHTFGLIWDTMVATAAAEPILFRRTLSEFWRD